MKTQIKKISEAFFSDPISTATEAKRRNLLAVACATILTSAYSFKITKVPWLEFEAPKNAPNFLQGLLATALIYFLCIYATNVFIDIARWWAAGKVVSFVEQEELLRKLEETIKHMRVVGAPKYSNVASALPERALSEASAFVHLLRKDVASIRRFTLTLKASLIIRLIAIDVVLPIGLGLMAEGMVIQHFLPFITTPFR